MKRSPCWFTVVALFAMLALPPLVAKAALETPDSWIALEETLAAASEKPIAAGADGVPTPTSKPACCVASAAPLPFHSIEGYSGGSITTMAYICNGGCDHTEVTLPVVSYGYMDLGSKNLHVVAVTQPLFGRIELGYAYNHLNIGSLYDDIRKAGMDPGRDNVRLHHFNARFKLLGEGSFGLPIPAITAGVHFKYNEGIDSIDRKLAGTLSSLGYKRHYGVDYTLTASKMFGTLAFGRPVILTGGLRLSRAAQLGYLGFGNQCFATFEGSVAVVATDRIILGYEFRQKKNPYKEIHGLLGPEDNWHAFSVSGIVNENLTISALYGMLGNVANARADCTLGVQVKYEF